jgi:hypothetical protein
MAKKEKRAVGSDVAAGVVAAVVQASAQTGGTVVIQAPAGPVAEGSYVCRHINTRLTLQMADQVKAIFTGLHATGATLSNGRHVDLPAHAVCWLLEKARVTGAIATIEAPWRPCAPGGHVARILEVRLTHRAAEQLKRIFTGLYAEHQRLRNGRHVDTLAHAVCWLLEHADTTASVERSIA